MVSSEYKNMVQARHSATSDACAMGGNTYIEYEVWLLVCKKRGKVAGLSLLLCCISGHLSLALPRTQGARTGLFDNTKQVISPHFASLFSSGKVETVISASA